MKIIHFRTFLILSLISLTLTVGALLVSLVLVAASLNQAATSIGENAAPSVVELADADSTLMTLRGLLDDRLDGRGDAASLDARSGVALQSLNENVDKYLSLPTYPGEPGLAGPLREALDDVNRIAARIQALPPGAPFDAALHHELARATDHLGTHLDQAGRFNAEFLGKLSARIAKLQRTALPLTILIDILGFATAAASVLIAFVLVQRFAAREAAAREQLEHRANELDGFAVQVAHDLLSPLMSANLALMLARERLPKDDAKTRDVLARAATSLVHVRSIVDGLLEFARAGAEPLPGVHANVNAVLREVGDTFAPLAEQGGVDLIIDAELPEPLHVATTPGVLTSLISNLIQNAMRAVAGREQKRIKVHVEERDGEMICIEVNDSGPGVSPEVAPQLFRPTPSGRVRGKGSPGLGLGLATVKKLADSYGGTVGFDSKAGEGATFWFMLPIEKAAA